MKKGRIKPNKAAQGILIKAKEPDDVNKQPIIFSLEKLQGGHYCLSGLDQEHKAMFAEAIFKRRSLTWDNIIQANRHQLGSEKIPINQIQTQIPPFITEEVGHLICLRYHELRPMVGYRNRNIFFVLWFDHDYSLYDHGN